MWGGSAIALLIHQFAHVVGTHKQLGHSACKAKSNRCERRGMGGRIKEGQLSVCGGIGAQLLAGCTTGGVDRAHGTLGVTPKLSVVGVCTGRYLAALLFPASLR